MATYSKHFLSGAIPDGQFSNGGPILLSATSAQPADLVHETSASTSITDEVWIYASNTHSSAVVLTIVFDYEDIKISIPSQSGLTLVIPGLLLRGNGESPGSIYAYAGTTNVVALSGYVNRIS